MNNLIPKQPHPEVKEQKRRYSDPKTRQSHIKKWKESHLTMSAYCRQKNISVSSFSKWVQNDAKETKSLFKPLISTAVAPPFKEVSTQIIEIHVGHPPLKIRFMNAADASLIINIIKGLGRCN